MTFVTRGRRNPVKAISSAHTNLTQRRVGQTRRAPVLLFGALLLPPLLLLEAWKSRSERYQHWVLTLFFGIYGATITIAYDPMGQGSDGVRHLLMVYVHYVDLSFSQWLYELGQILLLRPDGGSSDVYKHVVSYLVGGVLGMPWLFFPVVALVYGYFFSGSMLIIFRGWRSARLPLVTLFIVINFFLIKNIEGVNTVRTWTGLWVLVYGCLQFYQTRKLRYLLLMGMPPFIHFGYFIMALPAYAVLLLGNRVTAYMVLFALSAFTTFINPGQVGEIVSQTELGERKLSGYTREEKADAGETMRRIQGGGGRIWLALNKAGIQKWALLAFVYTLLASGIYQQAMNAFQQRIFSTGLLMITLSNSTWYLYAVSNRSWLIGAVFLMAAFVMWRLRVDGTGRSRLRQPVYKIGMHVAAVLFIPYFLYNLSTWLDYPSFFLLCAPFVPWLDPELNMSLKESLRFILVDLLQIL